MIDFADILVNFTQGTLETVWLAVVSCGLGLGLGVLFVFFQHYHNHAWLKKGIGTFCLLIQSLPEILILFSIYFGCSAVLTSVFQSNAEVPCFLAGTITLGLIFGAYASKILYSASLQVLKEDIEVSGNLGLSRIQTFYHIIWPQVWRYALPGLGSLWLIMLKDTVLISLIGGSDLMSRAQILIHNSQQPFKFYILISCIYLTLTILSEQFLKKVKDYA